MQIQKLSVQINVLSINKTICWCFYLRLSKFIINVSFRGIKINQSFYHTNTIIPAGIKTL